MSTPRRSGRLASLAQNSSPPQPAASPATAKKRKTNAAGDSPKAKRGKKEVKPDPSAGEETANGDAFKNGSDEKTDPPSQDVPMPDQPSEPADQKNGLEPEAASKDPAPTTNGAASADNAEAVPVQGGDAANDDANDKQPPAKDLAAEKGEATDSTDQKEETEPVEPPQKAPEAETKPATSNGHAVVPHAREDEVPSAVLEKGIIYFFFRARVNVDEPQGVNDVARSYMVMRPIPKHAELGAGPIGDDGNCRLLALPKKILPKSGKDRFMTFVEKTKLSFKDLKESFLTSSDYVTKTAGTSHVPAATPIAEGVYAITSTGRESHLAYVLTIPDQLGDVQKDIGLKERGSFITSVKNPDAAAPSNTSLPQGPDFPKEVRDEFAGRRWMPLQPRHLDYANTQFLIIGETFEHGTEQAPADEKKNEMPVAEMEKLEGEDEIRIKHLKGDDSVFADLGVTSKELPKLLTSW